MDWIRELLARWRREDRSPMVLSVTGKELQHRIEYTKVAVSCAYSFGWQAQSARFGLTEHSARVALIARWIGEGLGIAEEEIRTLEHAAQLHEIGMVAVPAALIRTPRPLTADELARVRAHARIGAEIVRTAYEPLKGDLIEHQYASLPGLRQRFENDDDALRLAAILRVADVYDTLTNPRPYQSDLPEQRWREVLEAGMGTQFEPGAAGLLLRGSV